MACTFAAHSDGLPLASLPGLLRRFGIGVPDDLKAAGSVQGDLTYGPAEGWRGSASVQDATLEIRGVAPLRFAEASVSLGNEAAHLNPVGMQSGEEPMGTVAADYFLKDGSFSVDLASSGGPLKSFLSAFPNVSVPLLSSVRKAGWKGKLRYVDSRRTPGTWTGVGELTDAVADVPWLASPVEISTAQVRIDNDAIQMSRMVLALDGTELRGDYRYAPGIPRPHQFHFALDTADTAQLETLLRPVLRRRPNLIDMALGRPSQPDWLRGMHAEGVLQIGTLLVAGTPVERVRTRVLWDGAQIALPDWQSRLAAGSLGGRVDVDVRESSPRYAAALRLNNMEWQGGTMSANLRLHTFGNGAATLGNLEVDGAFTGKDLEIEPIGVIEQLSGEGEMSWKGEGPQFRFPQIRLASGDNTWIGSGRSQAANEVVLQLSTNGKQMNLVGSLTNPSQPWIER